MPHLRALSLRSAALLASISACATEVVPADEVDESSETSALCSTKPTLVDHSLAITDATVLSHFAFSRTMTQLAASMGPSTTTPLALYQQWMNTFGPTDCADPQVDPNHYGLVCPRTPEQQLATVNPLDPNSPTKFTPVGVFNRFDLAPKSGVDCGEYRIVYAMQPGGLPGRAFLIFEGKMPNPDPTKGAAGCEPIAEFWQQLSNTNNFTTIGNKLDKFFYTGTAIAGVPAVVDARHYGVAVNHGGHATGQIRTNMLMGVEWNLREIKPRYTCSGSPAVCSMKMDHVTVKTNPADELFKGTAAKSADFLAAFPKQTGKLASTDPSTIGMTIATQFDEFESISTPGNPALGYSTIADAALFSAVQDQLVQRGLQTRLTPQNIFDRATTQTCGGCHMVSNGAILGDGVIWPASLGFVQINELSQLSDALGVFLTHRLSVLETFIGAHCAGTPLVDDGLTIGGSMVGAAN